MKTSFIKTFRSTHLLTALILVTALALVGIWLTFSVYVVRSDAPLARRLATNLPAARIGDSVVTYGAFLASRDALRAYLESPAGAQEAIQLTSSELDRKALDRLIEQALTEDLARERKIVVSPDEMKKMFADLVRSSSSTREEADGQIKNTFHWTEAQYLENLFRPQILATRIAATLTSSTKPNDQANAFANALSARRGKDKPRVYLNLK